MPKPPPVEYFECVCRMPVLTAGPIMAMLTKIEGLDVSAPHLVSEVKAYSRNTAVTGSNPEMGTKAFLTEWSKANPTFKASDAVKALRADGRGGGSAAYPALNALVEDGTLKKLSPGQYSRADVKHLPAPKKAKKNPTPDRREVDHRTFLLRAASRNHGRFNTSWMKAQFEKDERTPGNVSPTIAVLLKKKAIKRVGEGEYVLMQKAASPKKAEPKTNGAAVVTAAEA